MSESLSFATKYRSSSIDTYIGNDYAKSLMLGALTVGDDQQLSVPQVWVIHGESGCGKTTMARLVTKHLVCENRQVTEIAGRSVVTPCGICASCQAADHFIETGDDTQLYNVSELDSSKTRKVEDIDNFLVSASMPSLYGGIDIYIIDECHMLSQTAQSSFLKFTEDLPAGKIFMFCTTDPQKMLPALLNRAQVTIPIRKPSLEDNVAVLSRICDGEGVSYTKAALELIAERSDLVYRKSQNNLEAVVRSRGSVSMEVVAEVLGVQPIGIFIQFLDALFSRDLVTYTGIVSRIRAGVGFTAFIEQLSAVVAKGLYLRANAPVPGLVKEEVKSLKTLFSRFSEAQLVSLLSTLASPMANPEISLLTLGYRGLDAGVPLPDAAPRKPRAKAEEPTPAPDVPAVDVKDLSAAQRRQLALSEERYRSEVRRQSIEISSRERTVSAVSASLEDVSPDDVLNML